MKVAVVTGGSAGIGQAAAIEIAKLGIGVVLTYRTHEAEAKETVVAIEEAGGAAVALPLDTGDISTFDAFITDLAGIIAGKWGTSKIDFLVNNAGIGGGAPFGEVTEEMFDQFHRVLFKGPFFLTQSLLALMNDGGAIVNTGSNSALDTGTASGYSSYASHKGRGARAHSVLGQGTGASSYPGQCRGTWLDSHSHRRRHLHQDAGGHPASR